MDAFPSVKMTGFMVFERFYPNQHRKPRLSDVFDIIISAPLPYLDAVLTERNQAAMIRHVQRRDPFLDQVAIHTLADLR